MIRVSKVELRAIRLLGSPMGLHDMWNNIEENLGNPRTKIKIRQTGINDKVPYPRIPALVTNQKEGGDTPKWVRENSSRRVLQQHVD